MAISEFRFSSVEEAQAAARKRMDGAFPGPDLIGLARTLGNAMPTPAQVEKINSYEPEEIRRALMEITSDLSMGVDEPESEDRELRQVAYQATVHAMSYHRGFDVHQLTTRRVHPFAWWPTEDVIGEIVRQGRIDHPIVVAGPIQKEREWVVILDGRHRLVAAERMGWTTIPAVVASDSVIGPQEGNLYMDFMYVDGERRTAAE